MSGTAPAGGSRDAERVPLWGVLAAVAAPVLLVGGWSLAAARQPPTYDPRTDTLSALAALLVWFVNELQRETFAGLSERMAAGAEASWVGLAAATQRRSVRSGERAHGSPR